MNQREFEGLLTPVLMREAKECARGALMSDGTGRYGEWDCDDAVQKTLFGIVHSRAYLKREREGFTEWIRSSVSRKCTDIQSENARSCQNKNHISLDSATDVIGEDPKSVTDVISKLIRLEVSGDVREALQSLPTMQQKVLDMYHHDDLSRQEIVQQAGLSARQVKRYLEKSTTSLRRDLKKYDQPMPAIPVAVRMDRILSRLRASRKPTGRKPSENVRFIGVARKSGEAVGIGYIEGQSTERLIWMKSKLGARIKAHTNIGEKEI